MVNFSLKVIPHLGYSGALLFNWLVGLEEIRSWWDYLCWVVYYVLSDRIGWDGMGG